MRLLLTLLLLCASLSAQPSVYQANPDTSARNGKQGAQSTEKPTPPVETKPISCHCQPNTDSTKTGSDESSGWRAWIKDPAMALITAIYAFFSILTYRAVNKQARLAHDQAQTANSALGNSINATNAAADSAKAASKSANALINAERAWIEGELVKTDDSDVIQSCKYALQITNHGRTPARVIAWRVGFPVIDGEIRRRIERSDFGTTMRRELHVFLPSSPTQEELDAFELAAYWSKDWLSILAGQKTGTAYVVIEYADLISGGTHETEFAYAYSTAEQGLVRLDYLNNYS